MADIPLTWPDLCAARNGLLVNNNCGSNVQGVGNNVAGNTFNLYSSNFVLISLPPFIASFLGANSIHNTPVGIKGGPGQTGVEGVRRTYVEFFERENYEEALKGNREAYARCKETYGSMEPVTISERHNEALILAHMGRVDDAEVCIRQIYEDCVTKFGVNHRATLATMDKRAYVLILGEKYADAEVWSEKVCHGYENDFGKADPITLSAICCRALILDKLKRYADAEEFYERAYADRKACVKLGDSHPDTILSMYYRARFFAERKDRRNMDKAHEGYKEALEACQKYEKNYPWNDPRQSEVGRLRRKLRECFDAVS